MSQCRTCLNNACPSPYVELPGRPPDSSTWRLWNGPLAAAGCSHSVAASVDPCYICQTPAAKATHASMTTQNLGVWGNVFPGSSCNRPSSYTSLCTNHWELELKSSERDVRNDCLHAGSHTSPSRTSIRGCLALCYTCALFGVQVHLQLKQTSCTSMMATKL